MAVAVALAGCASIGPGTIQRDHLDYAGAIAETGVSPQVPVLTIPAN